MKLYKQAVRYGRRIVQSVVCVAAGVFATVVGSDAFAQTADAALDSIDVGTEITTKAGKLGGALGIAIGVMLILAAIGGAVMWGRRSFKSK